MVDKIDNSGMPQSRRLEPSNSRPAAVSESESQQPAAAPAEATSRGVSTYEQLQGKVNEAGDFDREKVEQVKAAIQSGEYSVNAERIAKAVIDLEHLLQA
ncbi:flagellar biosynthesis anti-sigma factor FlgM [Litorivivens sp.]|uniref:flagellar biosynthesis anti-sigma factor FlgM n=1 Tax=Litorivivens sp. TaxID=2020868 RepID=UPI0035632F44